MNRFHQQHKLLNVIRPHLPPLSSLYEERTGQPPLIRLVNHHVTKRTVPDSLIIAGQH